MCVSVCVCVCVCQSHQCENFIRRTLSDASILYSVYLLFTLILLYLIELQVVISSSLHTETTDIANQLLNTHTHTHARTHARTHITARSKKCDSFYLEGKVFNKTRIKAHQPDV